MDAALQTPELTQPAAAAFHAAPGSASWPPVLDACCGSRMMWFNPRDARALYVDKRREHHVIDIGSPGTIGRKDCVVDPDVLADFTELPFPANTFSLVVMDPPHLRRLEARGTLTKKYGVLIPGWEEMLRGAFEECFRVLKPHGTLIFKWCETEIPLERVLALTDEQPLFGHRSGAKCDVCGEAVDEPGQNICNDCEANGN